MSDTKKRPSRASELAALRRSLTVPTAEPTPSAEDVWAHDLLNRASFAQNITNFIRPQREPLVISLHGSWGSGKTFFLRRWVQTLKADGFPTFYYNAWEDDYATAPLIPILTKLEKTTTGSAARQLRKAALPFLFDLTIGLFKTKTGVDLRQFGIDPASLPKDDAVFDAYQRQTTHRGNLRTALASLAKSASQESARPTVCVIDELDRCRPTFAIELLETTKHVFNVPGLVFLLALNRSELAHSIRSVYGTIDADTYLRRFFDVHLDLPTADTVHYTKALVVRFGLDTFLGKLSDLSGNPVHGDDYRTLIDFLPLFWRQLRLSLRDIHHCVTGLSLACRNLPVSHFLYPPLLVALLSIRLRDPDLYRNFVSGDITPGKVFDKLDGWVYEPDVREILSSDKLSTGLETIEASLYAVTREVHVEREDDALTQLAQVANDEHPTHPDVLSTKTRADSSRAKRVQGRLPAPHYKYRSVPLEHGGLTHLAELISLVAVSDNTDK